jgi:hypothetical protein
MDYHKVYQSGKATPMQVLKKVLEGCQELEHLHIFSSLRPDDVMDKPRNQRRDGRLVNRCLSLTVFPSLSKI